jgi:hypothetical protein
MQVLPSTAASMGFPDVSSNRANVLAGAAYLAHLRSEWFDDPAIPETDRIYFSLAAYNAGPGAMQEIRRKARRTPGIDPDRWFGEVELVALRGGHPPVLRDVPAPAGVPVPGRGAAPYRRLSGRRPGASRPVRLTYSVYPPP